MDLTIFSVRLLLMLVAMNEHQYELIYSSAGKVTQFFIATGVAGEPCLGRSYAHSAAYQTLCTPCQLGWLHAGWCRCPLVQQGGTDGAGTLWVTQKSREVPWCTTSHPALGELDALNYLHTSIMIPTLSSFSSSSPRLSAARLLWCS